jgi:pimeloyl-ACP methyl ester carboxylesterase
VAFALAACGAVGGSARRVAALVGSSGGEMVRIAVTDEAGEDRMLVARVCRPAGSAPGPIAIIAHGLPPRGESRAAMSPAACSSPPARWFHDRGYAVVLPLRRGYGESEGDWPENPGACASPDYVRAGQEGARDLDAVLRFAVAQPYAKADGAVIVGEDAGGWAVLGYAARPRQGPEVALIDMAGVMNGRRDGHTCRPDLLVEAAAGFGAASHAPMLWIYPSNDTIIPDSVVKALHDAFVRAGGRAELVQPVSPDKDGHAMLFEAEGAEVWGSLFAFFLAPPS